MKEKKEKKYLIWYRLLYVFAGISALSLLPLIWVNSIEETRRKVFIVLCGASFWGFLGLELLCLIPCSILYWYLRQIHRLDKVYWRGEVRIGVISFLKNREGLFADLFALVATVSTVILYFLKVQKSWIVIPFVVLTLFSWNLRSLLNGKNRNLYLKIKKARRRANNEKHGA